MRSVSLEPRWSESRQALATVLDFVGREAEAASQVTLLSLPCSHVLDHILPIFPPKITVFCAFSPPGRDGSNEPQAGTQGQETAGKGTKRGELGPSFDAPDANQRIAWAAQDCADAEVRFNRFFIRF